MKTATSAPTIESAWRFLSWLLLGCATLVGIPCLIGCAAKFMGLINWPSDDSATMRWWLYLTLAALCSSLGWLALTSVLERPQITYQLLGRRWMDSLQSVGFSLGLLGLALSLMASWVFVLLLLGFLAICGLMQDLEERYSVAADFAKELAALRTSEANKGAERFLGARFPGPANALEQWLLTKAKTVGLNQASEELFAEYAHWAENNNIERLTRDAFLVWVRRQWERIGRRSAEKFWQAVRQRRRWDVGYKSYTSWCGAHKRFPCAPSVFKDKLEARIDACRRKGITQYVSRLLHDDHTATLDAGHYRAFCEEAGHPPAEEVDLQNALESGRQDARRKSLSEFAGHASGPQKNTVPSFAAYLVWCAARRILPASEEDFGRRFASQLRGHRRRTAEEAAGEFLRRVCDEASWDDASYQKYTGWCEQSGNLPVNESRYRGLVRARRRAARSQSVTNYLDTVERDKEWRSATYDNYLEICRARKELAIAKQQFDQRLAERMEAEARNSVADFIDRVARDNEWRTATYDRYREICQSDKRPAIANNTIPSFDWQIAERRRSEERRSAEDFAEYACRVDYVGQATYADYVAWCRDNNRPDTYEAMCTSILQSRELRRAADEFSDWLEYCRETRRQAGEYEGYVAWCGQHGYFAYQAVSFARAYDVTVRPWKTVIRACPECSGEPVRSGPGSCSRCGGSGRVLTGKTRRRHMGTRISRSGLPVDNFWYENVDAVCPECRGTGRPQITCGSCNGRGSVEQEVDRSLEDVARTFKRPLRPSHPQEK